MLGGGGAALEKVENGVPYQSKGFTVGSMD